MTFQANRRDRLVAGTFTPVPSSLFASTAWEALSQTALRLFGLMVGADARVHSGDGRVGFSYDEFVKRGNRSQQYRPSAPRTRRSRDNLSRLEGPWRRESNGKLGQLLPPDHIRSRWPASLPGAVNPRGMADTVG